jgi:hypothetical protein
LVKLGNNELRKLIRLLVQFPFIDVKKFKIPKSVASDINNTANDKKKAADKKRTKGTITITLSGYKINTGLSDAVFVKKKN